MSQLDFDEFEYDEYCNDEYRDDEYCDDDYPEDMVTDEDVWYAMTDGMYGDYPGGDVDYDWLGF